MTDRLGAGVCFTRTEAIDEYAHALPTPQAAGETDRPPVGALVPGRPGAESARTERTGGGHGVS